MRARNSFIISCCDITPLPSLMAFIFMTSTSRCPLIPRCTRYGNDIYISDYFRINSAPTEKFHFQPSPGRLTFAYAIPITSAKCIMRSIRRAKQISHSVGNAFKCETIYANKRFAMFLAKLDIFRKILLTVYFRAVRNIRLNIKLGRHQTEKHI